jgi:HPt (histidine-containing phosphotransfer) domain-containing protein
MEGDRERLLAASFDGYLSKPLQAKELKKVIGDVVSKRDCSENEAAGSLGALHKICDGDLNFMKELIDSFLATSPGLLARIDAALAAGDADRLAAAAHGWKGVSQTMGFEGLASLCRQLEEAGRLRELSGLQSVSKSLHLAWERMRPSLENALKGDR